MKEPKTEWITAWPLSGYYAAYIDMKKSLPHKDVSGQAQNTLGLPYWIPEQRYLTSQNDYIDVIANIIVDEYIFNDPVTQKPLIRFMVEKGKSAVYDGQLGNGMILLEFSEDLLSYRKRDDGLLGIESISGVDTRVSTAEKIKNPGIIPEGAIVKTTNKTEANFSEMSKEAKS